ncbi:MAG: hypothetical protein FD152_4549 [Xanthobacteraceae bacterium]|nr:MAG: hypothetical protein FD152_4549 [Xanthobacteraceae bacterium]
MPEHGYDKSVFINCPFDEDYAPLLQAILFAVLYLGFVPRIATETADSGDVRLDKIRGLIEASKYSVHDLSRCQARRKGEHYRLNMPFELGLDFGCRQYSPGHQGKKILVLEERPYRYQAAISDLSGCDIQSHGGNYQNAVRKVRNWLANAAQVNADGARKILDSYADFQESHYEQQLLAGFSDDDIQDYPTGELLASMNKWFAQGLPI